MNDRFFRNPRPTIRQFEYVVAVADYLHFGRAADACAVSQPGLSAQILQLEQTLDVQIFERSRRKVIVTPVGRQIVERARRILQETDELMRAAADAKEPLVGEVRLGVIPTIAPYLLPRLLPKVRKAFPKLRLILREDQTRRLVEALRTGRLDLLLLALPIEGDDLESHPLLLDPFVLAAPKGHPLTRKPVVTEKDLAGQSLLLLEEGHCLRDQALSLCTKAGAREESVRATSLNTLVQMVAAGLGITLLPALAVPVEAHRGSGIQTRPFADPSPGRQIGLLWRRSSGRGKSFELLAEQLGVGS